MDQWPAEPPDQDLGIFLATRGDNPFHLPVKTRLQAVGRYELWTHHGCIPSIKDGPCHSSLPRDRQAHLHP